MQSNFINGTFHKFNNDEAKEITQDYVGGTSSGSQGTSATGG